MNVYLDTNILIDQVLARPSFAEQANTILGLGYEGKVILYTSALSFITTLYVCKKYGYSVDEAKKALKAIASFVTVCGLTPQNVIDNLETTWKDYEDATQYTSAEAVNADVIITRNPKDFKLSSISVYTPDDFISSL